MNLYAVQDEIEITESLQDISRFTYIILYYNNACEYFRGIY